MVPHARRCGVAMRGWFRGFALWLVLCLSALSGGGMPATAAEAVADDEEMPAAATDPAPALPEGWTTLDTPALRFRFHPSDARLAESLARSGPRHLAELRAWLGRDPRRPYVVWLAATERRFTDLQGGRGPAWAAGTAWPRTGTIFLRTRELPAGSDVDQVLAHELSHLMLADAMGNREAPRWLREGLAQYTAEEYGPGTHAALAQAVFTRTLVPLRHLARSFPADPTARTLAYAESVDFVAWLLNRYGADALQAMVRELADGATVDRAVLLATGSAPASLEGEWMRRLSSTHGWLPALTSGGLLWVAISVLFVVAAARRRREQRLALKALEERERREDELAARALRIALQARAVTLPVERTAPTPRPAEVVAQDGVSDGLEGPADSSDQEGIPHEPFQRPALFVPVAWRDETGVKGPPVEGPAHGQPGRRREVIH